MNSIPGVRSIGQYGVMAFTVARRTHEIGIRMALGALQSQVIWMVMREVLLLIGIGVVAGLGSLRRRVYSGAPGQPGGGRSGPAL